MTSDIDELSYSVVVNHEEQYSIWPAERPVPAGWRAEGTTGSREECLDHVERVWVDMRPASLRRHLDGAPDDVA
ncbi:MbtH family NRPS accessory protein [Micromonospora sp. NPDC005174]|uniref:MbtH family protein n=1 Tax=unclassified Micromonospora TaxID=2617518 RepID=UPI0033B48E79